MLANFRILKALGTCSVGEFLAVEHDGRLIEGQITFLARTPAGGWMVTLDANGSTYEVYCSRGVCTLVSQVAEEAAWTFEELETARPVADTRTGRRFTASGM
ncbi:MAG: hypothetical protein R3E76_11040 [Planctomycetota bacterium]